MTKQILIATCLTLLMVLATVAKAQKITWQEDRPLTWDDFKGKADYNSGSGAVAYWNTVYTYNAELKEGSYHISFNIENIFDHRSSWVKRTATWSEYLLSHEQLHFDINELFTRKLANELRTAIYSNNFKAEIDSIYQKNKVEARAVQSKYDKETQHSNNKNMQYRWQLYIYMELKKLPRNY